ncbi:site-specific DNA-methyltransferase [Desulfofalx alkaliphila]|uniref:site-specific DNA-methyltransferase n=1 Tax=Desulfofalx alkaliphila TaxID=105483 RepID=UPI00068D34C8|nr:site-specific DNA-methyltransferase [Desulfofalx alkaliphila]
MNKGNEASYQLIWPGKEEALLAAHSPTGKKMYPVKEDSSHWATTENLYIEGDNLEALKLLRQSYANKIKCIYIDPPYNNVKDFVYKNNFKQQRDNHSHWLNLIYPRLILARQLLTEDGVIFISIDDNEIANLKIICDEIFKEENFVAILVWEKKKKGSFLRKSITNVKEYLLVYCKNKGRFEGLIGEINKRPETYPCINAQNKREIRKIPKGIASKYKEKNYFLPTGTVISDTTMSIVLHSDLVIKDGKLAEDVLIEGNWRYTQSLMEQFAQKNELYITRDLYIRRIVNKPRQKQLKDLLPRVGSDEEMSHQDINLDNLFASGWGSNEDADEEQRILFQVQGLMDYPKPVKLITKLIASVRDKNLWLLDFFSGSATAAHAVMLLNALDGGSRKYIMVQLPEKCGAHTVAYKNGYTNICEIGKERIRRAAQKIREETGADIDYGFRVYRIK